MNSEEIFYRFHRNHGSRVILQDRGSVASRSSGFGDAIVFSETQLHPGEFFVVEVEKNESGRLGQLRLGLTQVNPSMFSSKNIEIPQQACPDLMKFGKSWVYSLTDLTSIIGENREIPWPFYIEPSKIHVSEEHIETCYGGYSRANLRNQISNPHENAVDREVGLRVGVVYIPTDETDANLYFVVNGDVFGPCAFEIPYNERPLFAAVELYGKTKQIRLLQMHAEKSLKQMCRLVILKTHDMSKINESRLPKPIIDYLNFESDAV